MEARPPKALTLKKYGLTLDAWLAILEAQGGVCAVCQKLPTSLRLNVDHEHRPRWKKKPPEERAKAVRGLLCYWCNTAYVGRAITIQKAQNVVSYLEAFAARTATR
jgi:hypothetical protein